MTDQWPENLIELLRDRSAPRATSVEPTATEAAAYVGMKAAEYGAYILILLAPLAFWFMTP